MHGLLFFVSSVAKWVTKFIFLKKEKLHTYIETIDDWNSHGEPHEADASPKLQQRYLHKSFS